jgi:hypothetical protein
MDQPDCATPARLLHTPRAYPALSLQESALYLHPRPVPAQEFSIARRLSTVMRTIGRPKDYGSRCGRACYLAAPNRKNRIASKAPYKKIAFERWNKSIESKWAPSFYKRLDQS